MKGFRALLVAGAVVALAACGAGSNPTSSGTTTAPTTAAPAHDDSMAGMDMSDPTAMDTPGAHQHQAPVQPVVHGFKLNVPLPRPEFVLTDTRGRPYDFAARTRGKVTLLYFGYTQCPYQCPTAMADIGVALRKLSPGVRKKITVVFVTTDPKRDTPAALRAWLGNFNARFVGLTGSQSELDAAQRAARVTLSAPRPGEPAPQAGATAHGGGLLAYGRDDHAHLTYPAGTTAADLVRDLPLLVRRAPGH